MTSGEHLAPVALEVPIMSRQQMEADPERMSVHVRAVQVAPVQAAAAPMAGGLGTIGGAGAFLPATVATALVGKEPGRFGGTSEAWPQWRRKWMSYVREVEELFPRLSNRQHLTLLRHWLDQATA